MTFEWFIAKRYMRAQRRNGFLSFITNFAILGIALGTAALIITLAVLDGFEREIKTKVVEFTAHIEVQGFQNLTLPYDNSSIQRMMKKNSNIAVVSPYAAKEGMIRSKEGVDGIFLKGIDPSFDGIAPRQHLVKGMFLSAQGKSHQVVIGKKLATRLNVDVGDKLVLFVLPKNGQTRPKAMQFELAGIYESGMAEFDDVYAYTTLSDAQNFFQFGNDISGYDILVRDINEVDETAKQLQEQLGYPHYARTVFQLYHNLFSWVELQKKMSPILLGLIIIVATINIIGTLLMYVLEKTRAIGILKSLGARPGVIKKIFILQGLGISTIGIVLGNMVAYLFCMMQIQFKVITLPSEIYYMNSAPIMLRPEIFLIVTVIAYFLCLLTTILPARAAAALHPVDTLRFG
jgi:lipoprotein-releasing system permease protein